MGVFTGQTFCVSGKFSVSQGDLSALLVQHGGATASTPNKSVNFLVTDALGSAKTVKAQKDGIAIVREQWVRESIKQGKLVPDISLFLSIGGFKVNGAGASSLAATPASPAAAAAAAASSKKKAASAGTKRKAKAAVESEEDEEEDEEEEEEKEEASKKKPAAKRAKKAAGASPAAASSASPRPAGAAAAGAGAGSKDVFKGLVFACSGSFASGKAAVEGAIKKGGGVVASTLTSKVTHVVSNVWPSESEKTIRGARLGLQCVNESWVHQCVASGKLAKESYDNSSNRADDAEPEPCWTDGCGTNMVKSTKKQLATVVIMECPKCNNSIRFAKQGKFARM
jgi:NAD-dependent DNA ligase